MSQLKSIIKKIVPQNIRSNLRNFYLTCDRLLHNQKKIDTDAEYIRVHKQHTHTFFGYYDIPVFNRKDDIIYLRTTGNGDAEIILSNTNTLSEVSVTRTNAWNWQQGARLRWYPNSDDTIMFNDFINDNYVCRILNLKTHEEKTINSPIYDISHNGNWGLSINFERLGVMRPGYGYTNKLYRPSGDLRNEKISLVDMASRKSQTLLTYEQIADIMGDLHKDLSKNYINHLSFSPEDNRFLFFWLEKTSFIHNANLLVYDMDKKETLLLEKDLNASHYAWIDNNTILCTAMNRNVNNLQPRYNIYNLDGTKKTIHNPYLNKDGHPSMLSENIILTDSYPDRKRYQELFVTDINNSNKFSLANIYSVPVNSLELRTDLHPRVNMKKNMICIDANTDGYRSIIILKKDLK